MHVYESPHLYDYARELNDYSVADLIRRNAQHDLDALWSEIRKEYPRTDTHLRCGVPAEEIVAAAKDLDVDLIIISTHNFREFVSDAGSGRGILRLRRTIPLLFGEKNLKTVCFN